ncbi:plasma-membrane proton-efflux P-type ATPase [Sulfurivirga sp.]|uniref:plasma-membrane proton-efflux P-type ATPase n=1 Tax=Sulfurivirga sp. TaxID=2614236 RepID=UPI0025F9AADA|nr:plasma-membrane proton-efflux P-type ATPase [Sulfurivirga sp.]
MEKTEHVYPCLDSETAEQKLSEVGPNEIRERSVPGWLRLLRRFWGPIPWMIEVAAMLSAAVQRWEDFTIIMILLLVNAIVDFYQESKALSAVAALKKKLARTAIVCRDGQWQTIPARELVPGDVIRLRIGDIVPADAKLLDGDYLLVDQSALTGESLPVQKRAGDELYANSVIKQGEMVAQVTATGANTFFGKTVKLVARAEREARSHFQRMVIRVGNFLIAITLVMVAIIVAVGLWRHESPIELLIFSLVLTVSAIPVAMPAVLTVTMAVGAMALARRQAIVSRLAAIEELAGMDVLCSDKTGTLTQNRMTLAEPWLYGEHTAEELFLMAALASRRENNDPIEQPIFQWLEQNGLSERLNGARVESFIPFDPVRKRTEAKVALDGETLTVVKGAPQVVLGLCELPLEKREQVQAAIDALAADGYRTLGVAVRREKSDRFDLIGLIPLFDPPREDSREAVRQAKAQGVTVKMVTGDNLAVARHIARMLDIGDNILDVRELRGQSMEEYLVLAEVLSEAFVKVLGAARSEEEIRRLSRQIVETVKDELHQRPLPSGSVRRHESEIIRLIEQADGFAQVFPEDKYFIVDELQKADHIVGMTGDGVNDAPALKKADCGIAVEGATDAARAAADIVLTQPGLKVIVEAIDVARVTFERMKSYTIYRIAETLRIIFFMTLAITIFQFYPVTAIMIILLALLNDLPILMIATDNTHHPQHPVRWDMHEMLVLSSWLGLAGVVSSFTLFWIVMTWFNLPHEFIQTLFFTKLVVAGHNTIFNTRIDTWFFRRPWPSAKLFWTSQATALIGTVIAVYGFGLITPIGWQWAGIIWAYALAWFVFNDAVKVAVVRYYRRRKGVDVL